TRVCEKNPTPQPASTAYESSSGGFSLATIRRIVSPRASISCRYSFRSNGVKWMVISPVSRIGSTSLICEILGVLVFIGRLPCRSTLPESGSAWRNAPLPQKPTCHRIRQLGCQRQRRKYLGTEGRWYLLLMVCGY